MMMQLHAKNGNIFMLQSALKLKKLYSRSIFGPSCHINSKTRILNLYTGVTSCTTSENINAFQFVIKLKNNIQQMFAEKLQ